MRRLLTIIAGLVILGVATCALLPDDGPRPGQVRDEAMRAERLAASFPAAAENYFADVDNGVALTEQEIKGRNMWLVWSGGNDRFWDHLIQHSFGTFDLLKTISSAPGLPFGRYNRFAHFGVVNEPCFEPPTGPDSNRFGLWLDRRREDCPPDPFADPVKYPGVKIGARGVDGFPVGSYYGEPTGIVGLRLFPNPDFDAAARKRWDAKRYYEDPSYYQQKDLVRPYRVGMACAFCHIGPNPIAPPADPEHPTWANLNTTVGAQYFWFDRVFVWSGDTSNYIYQLLHAYAPGALDTSLVSTDNIVNPRTMNALYNVRARLLHAKPFGRETLTGGQLDNKQFNDFIPSGPLAELYNKPDIFAPRVLKDGADSVGALGALNRVFLNIGLFSEEWLLHFNPFAGGKRISPIQVADAQRNSVYWQATEQQTLYMAQFLMKAGQPDRLADLPEAVRARHLTADAATLDKGGTVFAERCARCHSSKLPEPIVGMQGPGAENCNGPNYLACWNTYWTWTKTGEFRQKMTAIVKSSDFLKDNYLSTEFRVPQPLLQTNACSPLARNALAGNIWDNFSSQSYKDLPSVGTIAVKDPFTGEDRTFAMPAGGRGYTRPPSLISLWSTAPFLLNNTVGPYEQDPSIEARMRVFNASIEEMLWPEKRGADAVLGDKGVGLIQRTTATSWLRVPPGFVPSFLSRLQTPLNWVFPGIFNDQGELRIGPIPAGAPINLLGNFDLLPEDRGLTAEIQRLWTLLGIAARLRHDMAAMPPNVDDATAMRIFAPLARRMYELGTCPDYVVNRGHYFGTDRFAEEPALSDADKRALIEFLKTF